VSVFLWEGMDIEVRKILLEVNVAPSSAWRVAHSISLAAILGAILVLEWLFPFTRVLTWLNVMLLTAVLGFVIGHGLSGQWLGLLIDSGNKMSLSRLQVLLWTLLILSGFLTAVAVNIAEGASEPLRITIPAELWLLMGISATSMVGAPLIQSVKRAHTTRDAAKAGGIEPLTNLSQESVSIRFRGQKMIHPQIDAASIADIFQDADANHEKTVSIGHVQMFFFTLILLFGYGAALAQLFSTGEPIFAFPELDGGMLALLGISHASFLVNKAIRS
jgi:hypothetical protein